MNQHRENNISATIVFGVIIAIITAIIFFVTSISDISTIVFRITITILAITLVILTLTYITSVILATLRCNSIFLCFFDRGSGIAFFSFFILILAIFILLITSTSATAIIVLKVLISILFGLFAAVVYCFTTLIACYINSVARNI